MCSVVDWCLGCVRILLPLVVGYVVGVFREPI